MLNFKLENNLYVTEKGLIFSYLTYIATITSNGIKSFGSFSHTSTRHLHKVCQLTNLQVISEDASGKSPAKPSFYKFERGVKCPPPSGDCLSQDLSWKLMKFMPLNLPTGIMSLILQGEKFSNRDKSIILPYLISNGIKEQTIITTLQLGDSHILF